MDTLHTNLEIERIVNGFHDHSLRKREWTHQAHLLTGLHTLFNNDLDSSIKIMRQGIKTYNVAIGGQNTDTGGYHDTITVFFLHALTAFIEQSGPYLSLLDLVNRLQETILVERPFMFQFYSRALLFSVEARRGWVEPDLRPLSHLHTIDFRPSK
ncbi:MAG: hypothetical protein AAF490_07590 [Chloroflexota bacterium]